MRADNHGEGGMLSLMAQIPPTYEGRRVAVCCWAWACLAPRCSTATA